jgi:hypothetical protein
MAGVSPTYLTSRGHLFLFFTGKTITAQAVVHLPIEQRVANPQVRRHFDAHAEEDFAQTILVLRAIGTKAA